VCMLGLCKFWLCFTGSLLVYFVSIPAAICSPNPLNYRTRLETESEFDSSWARQIGHFVLLWVNQVRFDFSSFKALIP